MRCSDHPCRLPTLATSTMGSCHDQVAMVRSVLPRRHQIVSRHTSMQQHWRRQSVCTSTQVGPSRITKGRVGAMMLWRSNLHAEHVSEPLLFLFGILEGTLKRCTHTVLVRGGLHKSGPQVLVVCLMFCGQVTWISSGLRVERVADVASTLFLADPLCGWAIVTHQNLPHAPSFSQSTCPVSEGNPAGSLSELLAIWQKRLGWAPVVQQLGLGHVVHVPLRVFLPAVCSKRFADPIVVGTQLVLFDHGLPSSPFFWLHLLPSPVERVLAVQGGLRRNCGLFRFACSSAGSHSDGLLQRSFAASASDVEIHGHIVVWGLFELWLGNTSPSRIPLTRCSGEAVAAIQVRVAGTPRWALRGLGRLRNCLKAYRRS
mmetsp:Transcript_95103/g.207957  ORF Transcript_95103/g.207957 Transcript_95103/m.207957 type:complete len:372 (-) Transcript_95103:646-1761(-)